MGVTVLQLADKLRTEADAYRYLENLRWPNGPICSHCDHHGATFIEPLNGVSRKGTGGCVTQRRVWRCLSCRKQFTVTTGTVMHASKLSLRIWILVFHEMCASKNGVAAREIQRKYGVHPRTAWHLMHRIRSAMKADGLLHTMRGEVVADETFIGGSWSNRHVSARNPGTPVPMGNGERRPGGYRGDKTVVLSLIERATGEVRSRVIPDVTGATLRKVIAEQVDMANTVLFTDEGHGYKPLSFELAGHKTVNHAEDEYVRYEADGIVTSNDAENFFSQLKRSLDGTHHHVSREHLPRYLAEFDFRHSTRTLSDAERLSMLIGQIHGKRLTYKRITS